MSKRDDAVLIRPLTRRDHEMFNALLTSAPETCLDEQGRLASLPPAMLGQSEILVAEIGGECIGAAAIVGGELGGPFVEPTWRGRGIGRALVRQATHEARRRGLALVVLCDQDTSNFYKKCGFRVEVETETPLGPALTMSR